MTLHWLLIWPTLLRLMPAVSLDYYSDVNADTLIRIIDEHHLAGLVLLVRTMPDEVWFEKTTKLLETTSANLIVIQFATTVSQSVDLP